MTTINRHVCYETLKRSLRRYRITALLGPRQCGKTTLAREVAGKEAAAFFDLEDPVDLARLEAPKQALEGLRGLVVIDEVQRRPDLFPLLRVLADRPGTPARFLILGSASPDLIRGASESLAGRIGFVDLGGFDAIEVGLEHTEHLWVRGGFPESFLGEDDAASYEWRENFIRTFLSRDLFELGITVPPEQMRRFWMMLSHYHGQTWNASEIAGSMGFSYKTAQRYLDLLVGAYMVRVLPPWTENLGKRIRKAPKIHLRDSGLFHNLQGIPDFHTLQGHPKLGASWEGFVIEHILRFLGVAPGEAFHWATHAGAELDLFLLRNGKRWGFEIKYGDAPRSTKSMSAAVESLGLDKLYVVYPGKTSYPLGDSIDVLAFQELCQRGNTIVSG